MSDIMKQVKVDNWGIYFLQRLKHFFNRTDYCDLTLQFQDNAQLKVHRLVLNACTEYFELLERTCEMYEDCLIMPDDLQADVVVPIINFMYTGQLEFRNELLEKLYQTSQIMNMPVLSKLLDAQRINPTVTTTYKAKTSGQAQQQNTPSVSNSKQSYGRPSIKRPYSKAFENPKSEKIIYIPPKKVHHNQHSRSDIVRTEVNIPTASQHSKSGGPVTFVQRKKIKDPFYLGDPRPTRYEVPEELDPENIYDDSFSSLSYESRPLQVHPETSKHYQSKKPDYGIFSEPSGSGRKYATDGATIDIVQRQQNKHGDNVHYNNENSPNEVKYERSVTKKSSNQLFDQVFDKEPQSSTGPKVTIETNDSNQSAKVDHAKIISEVLKKYPHLVNSNKNIKLKILDTKKKPNKKLSEPIRENVFVKCEPDQTMESISYQDVLDSKEAAKLIALGADNISGPWICLICGTPGKALHFPTYFNMRRHLVEVHKERPIPNICEYCGLRSNKRNYLLHHMYTKHNIPPPASYNFPKCSQCSYIALTEAFLIKHKASHTENREFRCNVCFTSFKTSTQLLRHIQSTGHKYSADRKQNLQCVYCMRQFLRENNLYTHLKTNHKMEAKRDGIVDDSDEERVEVEVPIKYEPQKTEEYESEEEEQEQPNSSLQYQIEAGADGNVHIITSARPQKQTILNAGFGNNTLQKQAQNQKMRTLNNTGVLMQEQTINVSNNDFNDDLIINEQEYVEENDALVGEEYFIANALGNRAVNINNETATMELPGCDQEPIYVQKSNMLKKSTQPIEIVISNEEQYITPQNSVMYDANGNPSKTLAVLTTLDSAHSNEMMILPDDYPLNVSEVDTKNSNIVVVYSHGTLDHNKQYIVPHYAQSQIVHNQDIGVHFTQGSAVLTPNYITTVASATPVMSGQVIIPQVMESFQEVPSEQIETNELDGAEPDQTQTNESQNLIEYTDIIEQDQRRLLSNPDPAKNNGSTNVSVAVVIEESGLESDDTAADVVTHMDVDISRQVGDSEAIVISNESVQESEADCEQSNANDEIHESAASDEVTLIEAETMEQESESVVERETTEINDIVENNATPDLVEQTINEEEVEKEQDEAESELTSNVEVPAKSAEKVLILASEWSDEEDDTEKGTCKHSTTAGGNNDNTQEVEESIENIQHEMEKQVTETIIENEVESQVYEDEPVPEEISEATGPNAIESAPTNNGVEKISSLLTDWEENDSKGNDSVNDEAAAPSEVIENSVTEDAEESIVSEDAEENNASEDAVVTQVVGQEAEPKKVANIRSLVSDWDEDDDDEK